MDGRGGGGIGEKTVECLLEVKPGLMLQKLGEFFSSVPVEFNLKDFSLVAGFIVVAPGQLEDLGQRRLSSLHLQLSNQ